MSSITNRCKSITDGAIDSKAILSNLSKTRLVFHSGAHQQTYEHQTEVLASLPLDELSEEDKSLCKLASEPPSPVFVFITQSTIFHPQGGGQPSDVGRISITTSESELSVDVLHARSSITYPGLVLHFGCFSGQESLKRNSQYPLSAKQFVDSEKRLLFSRLHTAGHCLGAATRTLLESKVANFDELKASHFPDAASCEFQGLIDGKYKGDIQKAVDEIVAADSEVRIEWWRKREFRERGLERLLPDDKVWQEIAIQVDENGEDTDAGGEDETRIRVVNIVGAEVYPCGGTHVPTTKECGKVGVRKISRQKGNSRVSYTVD